MKAPLARLKKHRNRLIIISYDVLMIPICWIISYLIRFDGAIEPLYWSSCLKALPIVCTMQTGTLYFTRLYRGLWKFASLPDLSRVLAASFIATLSTVVVLFFTSLLQNIPRGIFILDTLLLIIGLGGGRFFIRIFKDFLVRDLSRKKALIVGAGYAGEQVARQMLQARPSKYYPYGFLDDKLNIHGLEILGRPVLGASQDIEKICIQHDIALIILAIPSATSQEMTKILSFCHATSLPVRTLPSLNELLTHNNFLKLRDLHIEDLLGRPQVAFEQMAVKQQITSKRVLVTGGGGSIGSELCRQIASHKPELLIIAEQSEFNLFTIAEDLKRIHPDIDCRLELTDIRDKIAVSHLFKQYKPQVVYHAAAYKHVPLLENLIREAVLNNILGTHSIVHEAHIHAVEKFVLVSSDKAVHPTNIMGATKRVAEIICTAYNQESDTDFIIVRFGNVLDSTGSVVPIFKRQIKEGGPVTVTHPDAERFFMTIPEASQLILEASAQPGGGKICVLDMGEPIKIRELAEQMIKLSNRDQDVKIDYMGLRAGEKLKEELFYSEEELIKTAHQKIFKTEIQSFELDALLVFLEQFKMYCDQYDFKGLLEVLQKIVPEYAKNLDLELLPA